MWCMLKLHIILAPVGPMVSSVIFTYQRSMHILKLVTTFTVKKKEPTNFLPRPKEYLLS